MAVMERWDLGQVDNGYPVFVVRRGDQFRVGRAAFGFSSWWVGGWRHRDDLTPKSLAWRCCHGDYGDSATIDESELQTVKERGAREPWTT